MWILDCVALYLNPRVDLLFLQGFRVFIKCFLFLLVVHFDSRRDSSITGRTKRVSVRDNGSALTPLQHPENAFKRQAYDLCSYPKDSLLHLPTHTHTHTQNPGRLENAKRRRSCPPPPVQTLADLREGHCSSHAHGLTERYYL